jgi:hypothetical protein
MIDKNYVKTFVRQVLGCECPDEVFARIDCQSNIVLKNDIVLRNKINIGNRLLIYVVEVNNSDLLKNIIATLVRTGINERDEKGFNRFRLVIATDKLDKIKDKAEKIFKAIEIKDEKIYLHIVQQNEIRI